MPIPRAIARLNRSLTNPLLGWFAGRLPPFAIVIHRGRRSGRVFRTPVMAFPDGDTIIFALTYGPDTDWVRNILAAGGCRLIHGGRERALTCPRLSEHASPPSSLPAPVRLALRLLRVDHYLTMTPESATNAAAGDPRLDTRRS